MRLLHLSSGANAVSLCSEFRSAVAVVTWIGLMRLYIECLWGPPGGSTQVPKMIELLPSAIGLFLAGVLLVFILLVAFARAYRLLFGRKGRNEEHRAGIKAFLSNFD